MKVIAQATLQSTLFSWFSVTGGSTLLASTGSGTCGLTTLICHHSTNGIVGLILLNLPQMSSWFIFDWGL